MRIVSLLTLLGLVHCSQPHATSPASQPPASVAVTAPNPAQGHPVQAAPATDPPIRNQVASVNGVRHFGEALPADTVRKSLAEVLSNAEPHRTAPVRIEGQVVAVCEHMGCWMEVRDGRTQAHVRMHGHSFFLPRDVNGKRAVLVGTVVAAHPATECDQSAQSATGQVAQIEFDATGVEVYD
ncbi:MAG: DUF4920 domain-containing protein [Deltaproteobacteria bacterium]|nr:DUF4920 domain-containing protein [Deltaproteobacteria bacterium]